jgi:hypothetical protein
MDLDKGKGDVKGKGKGFLNKHEGSDRGWNVWHSPLLLHSAQL